MAIGYTVGFTVNNALGRIWFQASVQLQHDVDRMMGCHLEAARLRAKYAWLRLAGPKGRLP